MELGFISMPTFDIDTNFLFIPTCSCNWTHAAVVLNAEYSNCQLKHGQTAIMYSSMDNVGALIDSTDPAYRYSGIQPGSADTPE